MPRRNRPKPADQTSAERNIRWRHNSFFGHVRMMQIQCENIIHSPTTTADAKAIAQHIQSEARALTLALKERIDPK